jgi:hypothetical protein
MSSDQHPDDLFGAVVAEQLAQRLLVPGDALPIDALDEVVLAVALQGRGGEARVLAEEVRDPVPVLVKLQRPPPEMRIFSPGARA